MTDARMRTPATDPHAAAQSYWQRRVDLSWAAHRTRGQHILDAIVDGDGDRAWKLLRDWADADPAGAAKWRNALAAALRLAEFSEGRP